MLEQHLAAAAGVQLLAVPWRLEQYWLPARTPAELTALYLLEPGSGIAAAVVPAETKIPAALAGPAPRAALAAWLDGVGCSWFDPAAPLPLHAVSVPKPWGQELWFTGIEERGVSLAAGREVAAGHPCRSCSRRCPGGWPAAAPGSRCC